jgi:hypothetical protein
MFVAKTDTHTPNYMASHLRKLQPCPSVKLFLNCTHNQTNSATSGTQHQYDELHKGNITLSDCVSVHKLAHTPQNNLKILWV